MVAIAGELTADHQRIVLVAGGDDLHAIAAAAKMLETLTPLVSKTDPPGALQLPATWAAVVQLAHTFGPAWQPQERLRSWISDQVLLRTRDDLSIDYEPPADLVPYPWQVEGAAMIAALGRVLITDEPGTGKTITTILGLVERALGTDTADDVFPCVVVCPASVVDAWVQAFRDWTPAPILTAIAWRGTPSQRRALAGTADVYVTSYDTARIDSPVAGTKEMRPLLNLKPATVVVDECHLVKNPRAQRSQAVHRLAKRATTVVALSGTPITHHPGDLWSTLVALEPHAWPSKERWVNRYCFVLPGDYEESILGLHPHTEPEFRTTLLGQHRRVAKADVLTQLPAKVYSVRTVQLPAKWRTAYDEFENQMLAELPDNGGEISVMSMLAQLTHLSGLASAAADVRIEYGPDVDEDTGEPRRHVHLDLKAPSWKVDALLEVLEERPGQPVVAFAPSRQLVMLAGAAAVQSGLRVGYIVGGQSMTDRTATVDAFQRGELDLICATTGAGGVGLTLTAARTAVFLQRPWSLVEAIQAEDRIHRIGSERHDSVEIVDVVASNTIDTRVRAVLRDKAGQLADLVQDPRIVAELLGGASVTRLKEAS